MKSNKNQYSEINYKDFVKINKFTQSLKEEIDNDFLFIDNQPVSDLIDEDINLGSCFSKGKILGEDDEEIISINEILSKMKRGICLTRHDS